MLKNGKSIIGTIVPLNVSNIDTDIIIPKQFLQVIDKKGLGKYLFHNWRYLDKNQLVINEEFVLNKEIYRRSNILLTGENFGCGSSREHAVWSLLDYGFRVIIAPSFSDIFYNNSFINKLFLITLKYTEITFLFEYLSKNPKTNAQIDLSKNQITIHQLKFFFRLDDFHRSCLLDDLDNVGLTLKHSKSIQEYEKNVSIFLLKRLEFKS